MRPCADHRPAFLAERAGKRAISRRVGRDLCVPPGRVSPWAAHVSGAAVPETPVDEDGDALTHEHDISASSHLFAKRRVVDSVTNAVLAQVRTQCKFGGGVTSANSTHALRHTAICWLSYRDHCGSGSVGRAGM